MSHLATMCRHGLLVRQPIILTRGWLADVVARDTLGNVKRMLVLVALLVGVCSTTTTLGNEFHYLMFGVYGGATFRQLFALG